MRTVSSGVRFTFRTLSIAAMFASTAHAIESGIYAISNQCTGKQLGIQYNAPNPWDNVVTRDVATPGAIRWMIANNGDGTHTIKVPGTQSAMQVSFGNAATAANIDLWTDGGGASQRWVITRQADGSAKIASAANRKLLLDLEWGSRVPADNAWLMDENGTCGQQWIVTKLSEENPNARSSPAAFAMQKQLGRGINFGNMLEGSPGEGSWGPRLSEALFDKAKEAGFSTIRLPVRWSNHAQKTTPYTIGEAFFQRVDFAVREAIERDMNIVINMHHHRQLCGDTLDYGESAVDPSVLDARFVALWKQIAARYRNAPANRVLFELYNEPNTRCDGTRWNNLAKAALAEIRKTNPTRIVVLGPSRYNGVDGLPHFDVPNDPNLIVTIHNYDPFRFTHQGMTDDWNEWLGTTCCSAEQVAELRKNLDGAVAWARGRYPLWVGEFGSNEKADYASRVRYTRTMRDEMEARGLTWSYWELASIFGILDPNTLQWKTELRDALIR
jgi:endoglucanase